MNDKKYTELDVKSQLIKVLSRIIHSEDSYKEALDIREDIRK